jgi:hypothetical protein
MGKYFKLRMDSNHERRTQVLENVQEIQVQINNNSEIGDKNHVESTYDDKTSGSMKI